MAVYGINMGHCLVGANSGAIGINGIREQDLTREVGKLVIQHLQTMGHTVINCTVDSALSDTQALRSIVNKANEQPLDLFISIHFNCFGLASAHGTEIFTHNGLKLDPAVRILNNIVKLGYTDRGIKEKSLYVINHTKAKAMLIECCFISNKEDMAKYNKEKMALAIAEGITGTKVAAKVEDKTKYRAVAKSWLSKEEADKVIADLNKLGYKDAFILKV